MNEQKDNYIFTQLGEVVGYSAEITRSEAEKTAQGFYNDNPFDGPVIVSVFVFVVKQATLPGIE